MDVGNSYISEVHKHWLKMSAILPTFKRCNHATESTTFNHNESQKTVI
jgi:hypothetical protein